jgi:hypothetical protein
VIHVAVGEGPPISALTAVPSDTMSTTQIAVLLPDTLLRRMDAAVDWGLADSRGDAVLVALDQFLREAEARRVPASPNTDERVLAGPSV